jgi:hypothetical protein
MTSVSISSSLKKRRMEDRDQKAVRDGGVKPAFHNPSRLLLVRGAREVVGCGIVVAHVVRESLASVCMMRSGHVECRTRGAESVVMRICNCRDKLIFTDIFQCHGPGRCRQSGNTE